MNDTIKRLREMNDDSTLPNGTTQRWYAHPAQGIISTLENHMDPHAVDIVCDIGLDGKTCELIVAAVNALPALLDALEAYQDVAESANDQWSDDYLWNHWRLNEKMNKAREAMAKLEAKP